MATELLLKRWEVSVKWASGTISRETIVATSRGKAMADTWRSDAFSGSTYAEFLKFSRCRRGHYKPHRWGDRITACGRPAFFLGNNRQNVQVAFAGTNEQYVGNAHPYDVLPVEYRPDTYRDRDAIDSMKPVA